MAIRIVDSCQRKVDSRDLSSIVRPTLPPRAVNTQASDKIAAKSGRDVALRLSGFGDGTDLRLQGLVVLALDLEFGLELLDQEVEARDLEAQLLDVSGSRRTRSRILRENGGRTLLGVRSDARRRIGSRRNSALAEGSRRTRSESVGESVGPGGGSTGLSRLRWKVRRRYRSRIDWGELREKAAESAGRG